MSDKKSFDPISIGMNELTGGSENFDTSNPLFAKNKDRIAPSSDTNIDDTVKSTSSTFTGIDDADKKKKPPPPMFLCGCLKTPLGLAVIFGMISVLALAIGLGAGLKPTSDSSTSTVLVEPSVQPVPGVFFTMRVPGMPANALVADAGGVSTALLTAISNITSQPPSNINFVGLVTNQTTNGSSVLTAYRESSITLGGSRRLSGNDCTTIRTSKLIGITYTTYVQILVNCSSTASTNCFNSTVASLSALWSNTTSSTVETIFQTVNHTITTCANTSFSIENAVAPFPKPSRAFVVIGVPPSPTSSPSSIIGAPPPSSPSNSPTRSNSPSNSPTISNTATPTISETSSVSPTISITATPTISDSSSVSPTISNTATPTISETPSASLTPSNTPSNTPTATSSFAPPGFSWVPKKTLAVAMYGAGISANGRVVVVMADKLYTSTDGGVTWIAPATPVEGGSGWSGMGSDETGSKLFAHKFPDDVYMSTDLGFSWTAIPNSDGYFRKFSVSRNGNVLIGSTYGGVKISFDSGATWNMYGGSTLSSIDCRGVASSDDGTKLFVGGDGYTVYRSIDSGATFSIVGTAPSGSRWDALHCSANGQYVLVGTSYGNSLYRSSDTGATWSQVTITGISGNVAGVRMSADGSVMVVNSGNLWISRDYGVTWTQSGAGSSYLDGSIGLSADGNVMAGSKTYIGFFTSGSVNVTVPLPSVSITPAPSATSSTTSTATATRTATPSPSVSYTVPLPGAMWSLKKSLTVGTFGACISGNGRVMVGMSDKLWTSTDSGATWSAPTSPVATSTGYTGCGSDDRGTNMFAHMYGADVYKSTDYGISWTALAGSNGYFRKFFVSRSGTLLMGSSYGGVKISFDSGTTWGVTGGASVSSVDCRGVAGSDDGSKLFVGGDGTTVYRSIDSGATFSIVGTAPSGLRWDALHCSANGQYLLLGTSSSSSLYRSSDTGATWSQVSISGASNTAGVRVSSDGATMLVNAGSLYISRDYGVTWTSTDSSGHYLDGSMGVNADGTVFVGGKGYNGVWTSGSANMSIALPSVAASPTSTSTATATATRTATPSPTVSTVPLPGAMWSLKKSLTVGTFGACIIW
jgi:trimeric autotransporter adhesin